MTAPDTLNPPQETAFKCDYKDEIALACEGQAFYKEHEGKQYCVLHYPGKEKSADFDEALKSKLENKDFNFCGVWFPDNVDFRKFEFSASAYFRSATFSASAYFRSATFKDQISFAGEGTNRVFGENSTVDFQFARIEKPNHASFHTVTLSPTWFINIDASRFSFIDVEWNNRSTKQEITALQSREIQSPHQLLSIAYRNLADNTEDNHHYSDASMFRYKAMDALRLRRWRGFAVWSLGWWYWSASGYGEQIWRAFIMLIVVWAFFVPFFWQAPFIERVQRPLNPNETPPAPYGEQVIPKDFGSSCIYSFGVMTLQKPEPRPVKKTTKAIIIFETILGPLQAALLALAVRRKFMR